MFHADYASCVSNDFPPHTQEYGRRLASLFRHRFQSGEYTLGAVCQSSSTFSDKGHFRACPSPFITMRILSVLALFISVLSVCWGWSSPSTSRGASSRRNWLGQTAVAGAALVSSLAPSPAQAAGKKKQPQDKQIGISNDELTEIIIRDIQVNQFMVRADLTRSIYDESATFTDEIDTYQLDPWIQGTKRLFVADKSDVALVPDTLKVTDLEATFLFTENLTFNIPFLRPQVYLSGQVIMKRDPKTGLITSYREKWDQSVDTVLKSARFGG